MAFPKKTSTAIYEDCASLCKEFVEVVFEHCPREANKAAHTLASEAEETFPCVWKEDPPDFIIDVIANNVSMFPNII
jgi:hypothetical protein